MKTKVRAMLSLLALAMAMVAECTKFHEASSGLYHWGGNDGTVSYFDQHRDIESMTDVLMDSEMNVRQLGGGRRAISYAAIRHNAVPCNRAGRSYYNCRRGGPVNPYHRGCSVITRCRRIYN
ncbi:hypothetical protein HRI_000897800 [Hibiscus trionum]|uniref:Uncharacterized protein n=1 Tax=Hibiscus trionum TaxID=183268 RepID=A0A9W7H7B5_HIBTR|nr:hypothetical protein HRI_000897800 [Hibiscus trionum]